MAAYARHGGTARKRRLDYSNQLSLFADLEPYTASIETDAQGDGTPSVTAREPDVTRSNAFPVETAPAAAGEKEPTSIEAHAQDPEEGIAARDDGSGIPKDRGPPSVLAGVLTREAAPVPSRDFRIEPEHRIGEGSLREKALANIAAIRTLKQVETEGRDATAEEKVILARYAGWGAMPNVFRAHPPRDWESAAGQLRELLTEEEYASARASTPNAHYTSPAVIEGIWAAMLRFGIRPGAEILEPAMGIGHFFGLMPETLSAGGRRTGVELDSITARIANLLYPDSRIFAQGFEATPLPDNFFDAVIGNIPFGNYGVFDPAYRGKPALTRTIHDYFLARSLDKLRPGGVMAVITSRYTMDKQDSTIRRYLAAGADLLGAIRLPNTTFRENAGTEVTADILFLQKRAPQQEPAGERWEELAPFETKGGESIAINEYFARHPEMMLGDMTLEGSLYRGNEPSLAGAFSLTRLMEAVRQLPENAYAAHSPQRRLAQPAGPADLEGVKEGAYAERGGAIVIRCGAAFEPAGVSDSTAARIRGMMGVRDAVREVFRTQLEEASGEAIASARRRLNLVYDSFVRRYGALSSRENVRAFAGDPDQPLLLSLEHFDPETKRATKTPVFDRRTLERYRPVERAETAAEALAVSLNETGRIDWRRMEELTGHSDQELQRELGSLVYRNPEGGAWQTADEYLSGNVRAKLATAEAASGIDPGYARNVEALKAVQPSDLAPGDIEARLGSSWIPASDIRDFIAGLLEAAPSSVRVAHAESIATWTVEPDYGVKFSVSNTAANGTGRFRASDLIEQALNSRVPTAYDELEDGSRVINQAETIAAREKQQQLKDRFREWIWEDGERAQRLAREYNIRFNNTRLRSFDGSHLTLPGMCREQLRDRDLAPHQKNALWRILQTGTTLLAHVVGAGKTWTMAAAAMELRRLGLAKKPMFVVPNHLVEQWGAEFLRLYPQAKLFVAGRDHFQSGCRERAMARIATGTYDAVIVSHRSFEFLPVSDVLFNKFIGSQVAELEEAILEAQAESGDNRRIVKELEKAKKRLVAKLNKRAARENKDNTLTFEELGVDYLFVDEADLYKNLFYTTKMNRIAGLPNTDSNRAFDMYLKTRYIRERSGGRGVVFATGTPISNTMAEMYTMLRYLAPDLLKERGVEHFDAWASNFAEAVTALELAPDGSGYRMHTRFARFINLPELLSMFRAAADVQTADMLKLPRPSLAGGKPQVIAAPACESLKAYIGTLTARAEKLRSQRIDPSVDNMLKITGDGRKAALDMRLVEPFAQAARDTKVIRAVRSIRTIWEQTSAARSTQLVFCDLSTPDPERFNIYDEVRSRLIATGIPEGEIAFIHDAETDAAKMSLFNAVNSGRVRVLMGSTDKMGAGTNVQRRLAALHHLDAPWRPRDIEQREGRILRQGNLNAEVGIYRYVTEGSFDAYMWQTLETKARFIQQVMRGDTSVRSAEDLEGGALTYAEIKAIASGNPAVMEKVKVDTEIRKLDQLRAVHINQQHSIRWQIRSLPAEIAGAKVSLERLRVDIATRDRHSDEEFAMTVGKRVFAGKGAREEAANALTGAVLSWADDSTIQQRGSLRGFAIMSKGKAAGKRPLSSGENLPEIFVCGNGTYTAHLNASNPLGTVQSIEHTLRALDRLALDEEERILRLEKALTDYQAQAGRPFEHEARLKELLARQAQLNAALDLDKGEQQVAEPEALASGESLTPTPATGRLPQPISHIPPVSCE